MPVGKHLSGFNGCLLIFLVLKQFRGTDKRSYIETFGSGNRIPGRIENTFTLTLGTLLQECFPFCGVVFLLLRADSIAFEKLYIACPHDT